MAGRVESFPGGGTKWLMMCGCVDDAQLPVRHSSDPSATHPSIPTLLDSVGGWWQNRKCARTNSRLPTLLAPAVVARIGRFWLG
jgi:hypothetical protein